MSSDATSTLPGRLAEMDRLLHDIQADLLPDREPAPPMAEPSPPEERAVPIADSDGQIQALTELVTRLVASMRELLAGYERLVVQTAALPIAARRRAVPPPRQTPDVAVSAGPFRSLQALREFEQAISRLPGVRSVAVQGYEGTDRAVIEIRLRNP